MVCSPRAIGLLQHRIQNLCHRPHRADPLSKCPPVPVSNFGVEDGLPKSVERHTHGTLHGRIFGVPVSVQRRPPSV